LTRAVLGAFDDAVEIASAPKLEPFRRTCIYETTLIEAHRRQDLVSAAKAWALLTPERFDYATVAVGLLGRRPFGGYPYPDW
jgi:hypothetical protein